MANSYLPNASPAVGGGLPGLPVRAVNRVCGEQIYAKPGTYQWVCPAGVYSVCVVLVGGSGAGYWGTTSTHGGGAALAWKNNIVVNPGQSYTIVVGTAGIESLSRAPTSSMAFGVTAGAPTGSGFPTGGVPSGHDGGGNGGNGTAYGAGGAGGYSGNGGNGPASSSAAGGNPATNSGGGGAGSGSTTTGQAGGGGGVDIFGLGSDGVGAAYSGTGTPNNGTGGSGGNSASGAASAAGHGGAYGGGSGGYHEGNDGVVRIIWGAGRAFPSTNVGAS